LFFLEKIKKKKLKMAAANFTKKTNVRGKFNTSNANPSRVLSLSQLLGSVQKQRTQRAKRSTGRVPIKPLIPPKSLIIILKEKPEKAVYNRRIIDYKHCGLLQRYIGLGGKILPRRQTRLTAKQQRYIAKTIKSARVMGLLPFVSKEKGFFR
jgi:small subunit ribosomal protein S18